MAIFGKKWLIYFSLLWFLWLHLHQLLHLPELDVCWINWPQKPNSNFFALVQCHLGLQILYILKRKKNNHCNNLKEQILREISVGVLRSSETAIFFAILGALNFVDLVDFSHQKVQKIKANQNSEPLNVLEWQILKL